MMACSEREQARALAESSRVQWDGRVRDADGCEEWRTGRGAVAIAPHVSRPGGLAALRACIVAAYGAMAAHAPAQAYRGEWSAGRVRATCGFEAADASV